VQDPKSVKTVLWVSTLTNGDWRQWIVYTLKLLYFPFPAHVRLWMLFSGARPRRAFVI